jgi:hypothetical protein
LDCETTIFAGINISPGIKNFKKPFKQELVPAMVISGTGKDLPGNPGYFERKNEMM